jgi:tripartite-type tricarboxylate transporter receptor subunit TctC
MPAMLTFLRLLLPAVLAPVVLVLLAAHAHAQTYPVKPVRMLVGFPPGAGVDITTRLVTPRLAEALGQQFVVDNRAGAAGNIAAELAAKTPPDGYTLLFGSASLAMSQSLYKNLNYNLERDFEPVGLVASAPFILVVHPSVPVNSVKELVALAKSRPGQLSFASTGNGSTPHLTMEMFKTQAGVSLVHVPYKGTPQAVIDVMSGQVPVMFANTLSVLPLISGGRLRALGISGTKRSAAAPQIPTIAEAGMKDFEASTWFGVFSPTGTPPPIVQRLSTEIVRIVQQPDMKERLLTQGADPIGMPAEAFRAYVKAEIAKWGKVVQASGARVE